MISILRKPYPVIRAVSAPAQIGTVKNGPIPYNSYRGNDPDVLYYKPDTFITDEIKEKIQNYKRKSLHKISFLFYFHPPLNTKFD